MKIDPDRNHHILIIDDNPGIHDDFRKILLGDEALPNDLSEEEALLFGEIDQPLSMPVFEIDSAYQGKEGLELLEKSLRDNHPYAMAFVDVRMPRDGMEWKLRRRSGRNIQIFRSSSARRIPTIPGRKCSSGLVILIAY